MAASRILRFSLDDSDLGSPEHPLANSEPEIAEEPFAPRVGILRGSAADLVSDPYEVPLDELTADFPIDADADPESALDADALRAEIEAEWEKRLEETVLRVRQEAFDAGYGRAQDEMRQEVEETRTNLSHDAERMRTALDEFMTTMQPTVVGLALDASEAVLGCALSERAKLVAERALAEAVESLNGDGAIDVYLNPVDLLRIQESGLDGQLSGAIPGLRWHPDERMEEGDWVARSSQAVVRRVRSEMLESIRAGLGLDAAGAAEAT